MDLTGIQQAQIELSFFLASKIQIRYIKPNWDLSKQLFQLIGQSYYHHPLIIKNIKNWPSTPRLHDFLTSILLKNEQNVPKMDFL